jgi:glycosyl transferase family 25
MISTYFINLDRDADRRAAIEGELHRAGIAANRYPAVDGTALPPELAPYFAHGDGKPPLMTAGEIGCYASHLGIYREIVAKNVDVALVLEDDAVLAREMAPILEDILTQAPPGWDMILLCGNKDRAVRPLVSLKGGRTLVCYSRIPPTTAGYLITASGARKMLNPAVRRIWPVDWDTRTPWIFQMETFGVAPAPINQNTTTLDSSIVRGSGRSRLRTGLPRPTAYSWTNNPIRSPAAFFYNFRKLGPLWWLRCFISNSGIKVGHLLRPLVRRARKQHA